MGRFEYLDRQVDRVANIMRSSSRRKKVTYSDEGVSRQPSSSYYIGYCEDGETVEMIVSAAGFGGRVTGSHALKFPHQP